MPERNGLRRRRLRMNAKVLRQRQTGAEGANFEEFATIIAGTCTLRELGGQQMAVSGWQLAISS